MAETRVSDEKRPAMAGMLYADRLVVDSITTRDELAGLRAEWDALLNESGSTNPFMSWDWVASWHEHLARGPLCVLTVRDVGRLIGVVPLEQVSYRLPFGFQVPTLQPIGRGSLQYELRELLCLPGEQQRVAKAVLGYLRRSPRRWFVTVIDGLPDGEPYERVAQLARSREGGIMQEDVSYYLLNLPPSWDRFEASLKPKLRKNIHHAYSWLARDGHTIESEVWHEPERIGEALDRLIALQRRRVEHNSSVRHADYFSSPQICQFFDEISPRLLSQGKLHPFFLRVDGEIAAARFVLEQAGELYLYYSGFEPRWWKYSLPTILQVEIFKWAMQRGTRRVNLSVGIDPSKTRWRGRLVTRRTVVCVAPGLLPGAAFAAYAWVGKRDPHRWKRLFGAMPGAARSSPTRLADTALHGLTPLFGLALEGLALL